MNIILIISDTFRYDNLFDRAAMPVRTPCLDAFAERAVSASRMYAGSFPTIPHRTDLISGRFAWPWHPWQDVAKSAANIMPRLFGDARGHVSQLLGDCPHLFKNGFQACFDAAHTLRGQEGDVYFLRMNHPIEHAMPPEKTRSDRGFMKRNLVDIHCWINRNWRYEEDRFPARTAGLAVNFLEDNYRHDSFFLWLDFFDPHEPWDPPEYMVKRYDPDYAGTPMLHPNYGKAGDLTEAELRNLRAHYCAEAELVDRHVGRVLRKIDDLELWKNSIVIFTSDHGASLGEHSRTGKSNRSDRDDRLWPLYEEVSHVPFMIAAPGLEGGRTIDALLQPVDILPTVLDLADIEIDPPDPFHGSSFAPMLRGEAQPPIRDCAVTAQFLRKENGQIPINTATPVLRTEQWAYAPVGVEGGRELYDIASDPLCETNVAADHPDVAHDLQERFLAWLADLDAPQEAIDAFV